MKRFYPAVLERAGKGAFGVWFPDFPDCVAAGASQEDAIARAEHALARAIDAWSERDRPLPQPSPVETVTTPKGFVAFILVGVEPPDPSERVNVYLPKSLIAKADARAAELGMSRSSFFGFALSLVLGRVGGGFGLAARPRAKAGRIVVTEPPKRRR
ncbi:MAG: type II toxin-antitoxin system HicB family antitoxin [Rhizomicrobium sp.]